MSDDGSATGGRIALRGYAPGGRDSTIRVEIPLPHGWSPQRALRRAGWRPVALLGYADEADGRVTLEYTVHPASGHGAMTAAGSASTVGPVSVPQTDVVRQRLAAYAVVRGPDGVLLTELSERTTRAGLWVLPGGGVEPGETPADAVTREVWEESGQEIDLDDLVEVSAAHRIGEFRGVVEDFHAVRLVFAARCPKPGPLVVHDVDGSTGRAAWFPEDAVTDSHAPGHPAGGIASWSMDAARAVLSARRPPRRR